MSTVRHWTAWPTLAGALLLLNTSLTFGNVWPTPKIRWENALSVELAVCVLLVAVASRLAGRLARSVLPTVWVLLVAGHYLDVTAPGLYGRDFNLYWDSQHLTNVAGMLARAVPVWLVVLSVAAFALVAGAVWVLSRMALLTVAAAMTNAVARRALALLSVAIIALFAGPRLTDRIAHVAEFAAPATNAYARQARFVLAMAGPGGAAPAIGDSPLLERGLEGLGGADVLLVFVEAYGAVTYDNTQLAGALAASRQELADAVRDAGRAAVSAYVESPTFGASSWLAHLTLLTGVETRDQYAYVAVMASARDTLPKAFARQGYRSVALMPGMRQAWPEGAFYGFDTIYGRTLLDYQGPRFGWWSIPDQYALAKFDALEMNREGRPPIFATFPTSTTHAPFGPVPPYQPEWSKLLTADAYDPGDAASAIADAPDLTNLAPSYGKAMAYELRTFAGYVREHAGDHVVLILIGDHQPVAAVSGTGADRLVPIHVIANPGLVLNRLQAAGFQSGLDPARPGIGPMHALVPILLDAFGS